MIVPYAGGSRMCVLGEGEREAGGVDVCCLYDA